MAKVTVLTPRAPSYWTGCTTGLSIPSRMELDMSELLWIHSARMWGRQATEDHLDCLMPPLHPVLEEASTHSRQLRAGSSLLTGDDAWLPPLSLSSCFKLQMGYKSAKTWVPLAVRTATEMAPEVASAAAWLVAPAHRCLHACSPEAARTVLLCTRATRGMNLLAASKSCKVSH